MRSLLLKRLYLEIVSRRHGYLPDWGKTFSRERDAWNNALKSAKGGANILIATNTGGHVPSSTLESLLAVALTLRGANVHVMLCDEALPACLLCTVGLYPDHKQFVRYGPNRDACKGCYRPASRMYRSLGLTVHRFSELLVPEDEERAESVSASLPFADIPGYTMDGLSLGEHALAGALRFYARGDLEGQKYAEPILRRYLKAAILTAC
ncbi:MAG: capsule biosynthesis protein, partial [Dehalococcoidia bacterium]